MDLRYLHFNGPYRGMMLRRGDAGDSPCYRSIGPRAVGLAVEIRIADQIAQAIPPLRGHCRKIFSTRTVLAGQRYPKILERAVLHADVKRRITHVDEARGAPCGCEFAGPCHRPGIVVCAPLTAFVVESRRRVVEHAIGDITTAHVPDSGRDGRARTGDTAQLRDGAFSLRHKMQHQQREHAIEAAIGKWQRANVANLEGNSRIANGLARVVDVDRREVDAGDAARIDTP